MSRGAIAVPSRPGSRCAPARTQAVGVNRHGRILLPASMRRTCRLATLGRLAARRRWTRRPGLQVPEHSPTPFLSLQPGTLSHRTASTDACYYKYDVSRIQRRPEGRRSGSVTESVTVSVAARHGVAEGEAGWPPRSLRPRRSPLAAAHPPLGVAVEPPPRAVTSENALR